MRSLRYQMELESKFKCNPQKSEIKKSEIRKSQLFEILLQIKMEHLIKCTNVDIPEIKYGNLNTISELSSIIKTMRIDENCKNELLKLFGDMKLFNLDQREMMITLLVNDLHFPRSELDRIFKYSSGRWKIDNTINIKYFVNSIDFTKIFDPQLYMKKVDSNILFLDKDADELRKPFLIPVFFDGSIYTLDPTVDTYINANSLMIVDNYETITMQYNNLYPNQSGNKRNSFMAASLAGNYNINIDAVIIADYMEVVNLRVDNKVKDGAVSLDRDTLSLITKDMSTLKLEKLRSINKQMNEIVESNYVTKDLDYGIKIRYIPNKSNGKFDSGQVKLYHNDKLALVSYFDNGKISGKQYLYLTLRSKNITVDNQIVTATYKSRDYFYIDIEYFNGDKSILKLSRDSISDNYIIETDDPSEQYILSYNYPILDKNKTFTLRSRNGSMVKHFPMQGINFNELFDMDKFSIKINNSDRDIYRYILELTKTVQDVFWTIGEYRIMKQ